MPRRRRSTTESKAQAEEAVPLEQQGLDELIDWDELKVKKPPEELTPWEKLKIVIALKDRLSVSDIAEQLGLRRVSVTKMLRFSRDNLRSRGLDPDKMYEYISKGASYWSMVFFLNDDEFKKILNESADYADFVMKLKDYRARASERPGKKEFRLTIEEFLELLFLNNYGPLIGHKAQMKLGEEFTIKIEPIKGMFYMGPDRRVELAIWGKDENNPIFIEEDDNE